MKKRVAGVEYVQISTRSEGMENASLFRDELKQHIAKFIDKTLVAY